eukprot:2250867-Alexandrium_andersonii.AAC.1
MCPTAVPTCGPLSSSRISGKPHEAALAGRSWRKRAPRASWDRWSLIANSTWALAPSSRPFTTPLPTLGRLMCRLR